MTIPTFLASSFRFLETSSVTDMADVVTQLRSELVTNGGWTEPTSKTFKSPVDADGRFFTVTVLDESSTEMEWTVKNQFGIVVVNRREIFLDGGGTTIRIWSSPYYVFVESDAASDYFAMAGMLDLSPEGQASHQCYVYGNASATSAGGADGNFDRFYKIYMVDNGAAGMVERVIGYGKADGTNPTFITGSGGEIYKTVELVAQIGGSANRWAGRMFQALLADSSVPITNTRTVPIDDSTTATFKATSMGIGSAACRLMIRSA